MRITKQGWQEDTSECKALVDTKSLQGENFSVSIGDICLVEQLGNGAGGQVNLNEGNAAWKISSAPLEFVEVGVIFKI